MRCVFILSAEILGQMVRNSQDVTGIKIEDKMFNLSQFTDDTQLFLDGSEKSLRDFKNPKYILQDVRFET